MDEFDLFFGVSNSDDQERNKSSSTDNSNRKQWSSVVPAAPQEPLYGFPMDEPFDRSLSQVLQRSQVQNKPTKQLPKKFKVPFVNDTSFDDLSVDSLQNFSLSQALLPSQKRQNGNMLSSQNDRKRTSSFSDKGPFIHSHLKTAANGASQVSVSHAVQSVMFNNSQANTPGRISYLSDAMTPSNNTVTKHKTSKEKYASENKENYNNYSGIFSSPECKISKSQDSVFNDSVTQGVTDCLLTPAPLCFTGQKNVQHKLRSVDEIPVRFREIFEFPYFNMVQSMVFDEVFYTDKPVVVAAPTGAGKTIIFELAIIRLLTKLKNSRTNWKIVYMAPMKALCAEKYLDWKSKFSPHSLNLMELTGDTELEDFSELHQVNLILTTPEKWDSMSRKWKDNRSLFQMIELFLIDEIHIVNDSNRGATVEAVLSRMKTLQLPEKSADRSNMRFIAVSATMPNIEDIAKWLGSGVRPAVHYKLDEKYRPVHLQKIVIGYPFKEGFSEFRFDMNLAYKLKGIIDAYSEHKPTLIFCSSRKSVQYTGETLKKEHYGRSLLKAQHRDHVQRISRTLNDSKVSELVYLGIGIHHAGMAVQDRNLVENLFREGHLPVLISTSTLAMGVNLPAHLVVVKSTMFYNMGVPTEYSDTQVLQMIGRAGRPQFDKSATAVIMTKASTKSKYESLMNGTQLIESSLHKNLIEHLNAEVVLHTITDIALAVEWIRHTFLYVRVMKNPRHYGYPTGLDWKQIEKRLEDLCLTNLNLLAGLNLVNLNEETLKIVPTDTGKLMARYCIAFETMKNFHSVKSDASLKDLIDVIAGCREFEDITLRNNEKSVLNTLNKDKHKENIRFPITGKIKTKQMKVNCLLQAQLGCLSIQDFSLSQDVNKIFRIGQRVTKCLMEFLWQKKDYTSLLTAIQLFKCMKTKLWEDSKYVTKQLDGIGPTMSLALVNAGLTSFHTLEDTNPREIELIVNRHPPFGNQIRNAVAALPKYEMAIEQLKNYKPQSSEIVISINLVNKEAIVDYKGGKIDHQSVLLIGDQDNSVVFKWRIIDASIVRDDGWSRRIEVKRASGGPDLHVHLLSQEYVGLDIHTNYTPIYTGKFCRESNFEAAGGRYSISKEMQKTPSGTQKDRSCHHKCLNKSVCAHKCCKQGLSSLPKTPVGSRMGENKQSRPCDTTVREKKGVEAQIGMLKNKMLQLKDAMPNSKRQNDSRLSGSAVDLDRFAYHKPSPLKLRTTDLPPKPLPPSNEAEPSNYKQQDSTGGWTQLEMYQQERESLVQQDAFDIGMFGTPEMLDQNVEDMIQDYDFEEHNTNQKQNTHQWSSSPFSDEELCLAEEMAQYSQYNESLNTAPTDELKNQTSRLDVFQQPHKQQAVRHSGPKFHFQTTEPVSCTNQSHYVQRQLKRSVLDSPYFLENQRSKPQNISQTIPIFDVDENQYIYLEESAKEKPMTVDRVSKRFVPYKKFPAYSSSNIFDEDDENYYDSEYKTCGSVLDNIKKNPSMYTIHEPPSNDIHNSHRTASPRHTYGQVVAWVSEEPASVNLEKSQPLSKQCKTPLLIPARSPLQTHSKSPNQANCEFIFNQQDILPCEEDALNTIMPSSNKTEMTSSFFQPYRSDSIAEVPDVGSNLFAGIF
ncbi:probable ATP-dependent DNA helicase HFM1 [Gigantopelta aegis]|uniref:probable ATP-dependent DNA helicase HFM1 n=1 Tax=Gigantopelta aegis TaxID=1735272 RepID=UPI001B887E42|nr:probable ATP-dependent DNA helicase HFM1 [Gigantopelta aegis]